MRLKKVNDIEIFESFLNNLKEEYRNDKYVNYDETRLKKEYGDLVDGKTKLYVLLDADFILAYLTMRNEDDGIVCFHDVFVKNNFRGKGYGRILLKEGFNLAKSLGYNKVVLASRRGKEGFYFKCGLSGEGLLQVDIDKCKKSDIEEFLIQNNIKEYRYKIWNDAVHQFSVNLEDILNLTDFLEKLDRKEYNFNVLFYKIFN